MTTAIPLTLHLLMLIGAYQVAAGLAGLTGQISWPALIEEFERSPALTLVTGFLAFAIGGAILLAHCHWTDPLAIIVTLVGWIALIEGLAIMALPKPLLGFSRRLVGNQKLVSLVSLLVGAALILLGLTGHADPTFI